MAEGGPRSSSRIIKPKVKEGFLYDKESVSFLLRRGSTEERQHHSSDLDSNEVFEATNYSGENRKSLQWLDINLPLTGNFYTPQITTLSQFQCKDTSSDTFSDNSVTKVVRPHQEEDTLVDVNKPENSGKSSTRFDFLEADNCFLSVSTVDNISGMSDNDLCKGDDCEGCSKHRIDSEADNVTIDPIDALMNAVRKIDLLANKVISLESRLGKVEDSGQESNQEISRPSKSPKKSKSDKSKMGRVDEEKRRQLKVLVDQMNSKKDSGCDNKKESDSSDNSVEESAGGTGPSQIKKKMTKKQRDSCRKKVASRLKQAGTVNPDSDDEASESSGKESVLSTSSVRNCCKHSNKVISGAKVSKRPVVKTELWPHTIAVEEDGEEVDSENINLSTFYSGFTHIMSSCKGAECRGRAALLHAVSMVVKNLHWPDARTFHNLIMVKIEQERVSWDDDFAGMALDFIDKKVRLSCRGKQSSAGSGANPSRPNYNGRGAGRWFRGQNQRNDFGSGRGKPIYGAICWQYNFSTCSYGENCKRWHCCKVCAESGKLGEQHRGASHENAGPRPRGRE